MSRLLLSILLVGAPAGMAQQSGVQVIRAEWGAGQTWSDVTARVQAMVDARQASFRVDTEALGNDPLPGTPKTLRVRTRAQNRQIQSFEYRDLDTVDLRTWGVMPGSGGRIIPFGRDPRGRGRTPGGWTGSSSSSSLRILSAQYGEGQRQNDVTALLNNAIQGNALSLQATNQNLGGDPAPAVAKRLTVQYQWQGQTYNMTVPENGWLRLPDTAAASGSVTYAGLRIVQASYGKDSRQLDVTSRLQSMVANDALSVRASNDQMGGDPARGADKKLVVVYEWQGNRYEASVNEDRTLTLPRSGDQVVSTASGVSKAGIVSDTSGRYFDNADQVWKINGNGVCFYRQTYFKGDAVCVLSGQEAATLSADGNAQFLSLRFFGNARQVQAWSQTNFTGRVNRYTRDVTDLSRASVSPLGSSGSAQTVVSVRVN